MSINFIFLSPFAWPKQRSASALPVVSLILCSIFVTLFVTQFWMWKGRFDTAPPQKIIFNTMPLNQRRRAKADGHSVSSTFISSLLVNDRSFPAASALQGTCFLLRSNINFIPVFSPLAPSSCACHRRSQGGCRGCMCTSRVLETFKSKHRKFARRNLREAWKAWPIIWRRRKKRKRRVHSPQ